MDGLHVTSFISLSPPSARLLNLFAVSMLDNVVDTVVAVNLVVVESAAFGLTATDN